MILPRGSALPAHWEQAFSTFFDQQRAFDLHLLSGETEQAGTNQSLGRWQITEIPAGRRGAVEIMVQVEINPSGQVLVSANQAGNRLPVTRLTAAHPNLPVTGKLQHPTGERRSQDGPDLRQLGAEEIQQLRERGYEINATGRLVAGSQPQKKGLFRRRKSQLIELSPEEILSLAGKPLAPEESRRCPNPRCQAVIPLTAEQCEWCGQELKD